jgi:hypothetical protein
MDPEFTIVQCKCWMRKKSSQGQNIAWKDSIIYCMCNNPLKSLGTQLLGASNHGYTHRSNLVSYRPWDDEWDMNEASVRLFATQVAHWPSSPWSPCWSSRVTCQMSPVQPWCASPEWLVLVVPEYWHWLFAEQLMQVRALVSLTYIWSCPASFRQTSQTSHRVSEDIHREHILLVVSSRF